MLCKSVDLLEAYSFPTSIQSSTLLNTRVLSGRKFISDTKSVFKLHFRGYCQTRFQLADTKQGSKSEIGERGVIWRVRGDSV